MCSTCLIRQEQFEILGLLLFTCLTYITQAAARKLIQRTAAAQPTQAGAPVVKILTLTQIMKKENKNEYYNNMITNPRRRSFDENFNVNKD